MEKMIFSAKQPQITLSNKKALVLINEKENSHPVMDAEGNPTKDTLTEYEYDGVWIDDVLSEQDVLPKVKAYVIALITAYDSSKEVNNFTINGVDVWLDRSTRVALMRRCEAEKTSGVTTTTLWYGDTVFKMPVDTAITVLNEIEIYACKSFDVTAAHKAAVAELGNIEDLLTYDYKAGYPDNLVFSV
jgi:hypothetical protein